MGKFRLSSWNVIEYDDKEDIERLEETAKDIADKKETSTMQWIAMRLWIQDAKENYVSTQDYKKKLKEALSRK